MLKCEEDPYNSETRAGYVNLGTAVNALVEDIISDRLMKVHISDTYYNKPNLPTIAFSPFH